jgi:hypothetical protein
VIVGYASSVVVDPDRESRRGRVLKVVGIVATLVGAGLLLGGVIGIAATAVEGNPFAFFWMPFVGGFGLAAGILMWVMGNLMLGSARFTRGNPIAARFPQVAAPTAGSVSGWSCPKCGNQNQPAVTVCSVCGAARG